MASPGYIPRNGSRFRIMAREQRRKEKRYLKSQTFTDQISLCSLARWFVRSFVCPHSICTAARIQLFKCLRSLIQHFINWLINLLIYIISMIYVQRHFVAIVCGSREKWWKLIMHIYCVFTFNAQPFFELSTCLPNCVAGNCYCF